MLLTYSGWEQDPAKHPTTQEDSCPTTKNYLAPNLNSIKVEKPDLNRHATHHWDSWRLTSTMPVPRVPVRSQKMVSSLGTGSLSWEADHDAQRPRPGMGRGGRGAELLRYPGNGTDMTGWETQPRMTVTDRGHLINPGAARCDPQWLQGPV